MLNPASGRTPDGAPAPAAAAGRRRATCRASASPRSSLDDGVPVGVERAGVVLAPDEGWERGAEQRRRRGPAHHVGAVARPARDDLRRLRPARPDAGARRLGGPAPRGGGSGRCTSSTSRTSTPTSTCSPTRTRVFFPEPVPGPGRRARLRDAAPADVGPRLDPRRRGRPTCRPASTDDRPGIWISYVPGRRGRARPARAHAPARAPAASRCREYDFEALKIGAGPPPMRVDGGLAADPPRRRPASCRAGFDPAAEACDYAAGAMLLDAGRPVAGARPHDRAAPRARDRRRAGRHRAQRRLPDRDRGDRRRHVTSSTAWPTRRSASRDSTGS